MQGPRERMRWTEWATLALAAAAIVVPFATGRTSIDQAGFHAGTAPAAIIIVLTFVHMWARRSGFLHGSRYLALFTVVLAVWLALSGFILREPPAYTWSILVVGTLLGVVATYDAYLSWPSREGRRPLDPRTNV